MACTITLSRTIAASQVYAQLRPLLLSFTPSGATAAVATEPALTIGDSVKQFILSPPFAWRWNRATTTFSISPATSSTVSTSGGTAVAKTAGDSFVTGSSWVGQSIYISGVPYTIYSVLNASNLLLTSNAPTGTGLPATLGGQDFIENLSTFGWLEKVIIYDSTAAQQYEMENKLCLPDSVTQGRPIQAAAMFDDDTGNITFRFFPPPDKTYIATAIYQKAPALFSAITDTWTPIPDYFSYLYNSGFRAHTYEQAGDERFAFAFQNFFRQVIAVNEGLTESQVNLFLDYRIITQREAQEKLGTAALGRAGRGMAQGTQ